MAHHPERIDLDLFMVQQVEQRPEAFLRAVGILKTGEQVQEVTLLFKTLRTRLTRKPDLLIQLTDVKENKRLIHLEFQSRNHKNMYLRMREYDLLLEKKYPEYLREQFVIYLGKAEPTMIRQGGNRNLSFWYRMIDFRKVPPELLTASRLPYLVILSVLTARREAEILERVSSAAQILHELEAEGVLDFDEKIAYLYDLQMMVTIRNAKLSLLIETEKSMKLDPTVLPSYKQGIEKGLEQGIEKGLEKGLVQGLEEGIEQGKIELCLRMWRKGMSPEFIRETAELNNDEWKAFQEKLRAENS